MWKPQTASHLEAYLPAASVRQYLEVCDIFEQVTSQEADNGRRRAPDDTSRRVQAEVDLIPTFASTIGFTREQMKQWWISNLVCPQALI